jgi:hypothetical protein
MYIRKAKSHNDLNHPLQTVHMIKGDTLCTSPCGRNVACLTVWPDLIFEIQRRRCQTASAGTWTLTKHRGVPQSRRADAVSRPDHHRGHGTHRDDSKGQRWLVWVNGSWSPGGDEYEDFRILRTCSKPATTLCCM